jgi:hypothetical protein
MLLTSALSASRQATSCGDDVDVKNAKATSSSSTRGIASSPFSVPPTAQRLPLSAAVSANPERAVGIRALVVQLSVPVPVAVRAARLTSWLRSGAILSIYGMFT